MKIFRFAERHGLLLPLFCLLIASPGAARGEGGFAAVGSLPGMLEYVARDPWSEALGGAGLAVATGPFATLANAAPLPAGDQAGLGYGFFKYYNFYNYDYLAAVDERGPWRFSAVGVQMKTDPIINRTAYNPEGDGTTSVYTNKFLLLNASYDLAAKLWSAHPDLQWTVGAGWRYHQFQWDDESVGGWDTDVGTSVRFTRPLGRARVEISGSALLRNVAHQTLVVDNRTGALPRFRDIGLAVAILFDLMERQGDELALLLARSTRKDQLVEDDGFFGYERLGAELNLFQIVALRIGDDNRRRIEEQTSYGLGLTLPESLTFPFTVGYDFAKLNHNEELDSLGLPINGERELHSIIVQYRF